MPTCFCIALVSVSLAANSGDLTLLGILLGHDMQVSTNPCLAGSGWLLFTGVGARLLVPQTRMGGGFSNNTSKPDPLVRLPNGTTALHIASLTNRPEAVSMLLVR